MSRWDRLFDDLESQLESELGAEQADLAAEEERLRLGRIDVRSRIAAAIAAGGAHALLHLEVLGVPRRVQADALGRDWVGGRERFDDDRLGDALLVPVAAIESLSWSPEAVTATLAPTAVSPLSARIGLAFALRDLCRRRVAVDVHTRSGARHGTIDRVGRDHLDLAEHAVGAVRRHAEVVGVRTVPFDAIGVIAHPA